jgi:alanine racemase
MYSLNQIAAIVHAHICEISPVTVMEKEIIEHLLLDSRRIFNPKHALFFALSGPNHDGHLFIEQAYQSGVRNFVVSKTDHFKGLGTRFLMVNDVLDALQKLVTLHRNQLNLNVIGITGSNGKTIVKEWLHQLLHNNYRIVRNPKSFNSQVGVALSVWQANEHHNLGIFEAGISKPGEMEKLQHMIQPEWGIFTNIGDAHSAGFESLQQKVREKLILFSESKHLILSSDHHTVFNEAKAFVAHRPYLQLHTWSWHRDANLQVLNVAETRKGKRINALFDSEEIEVEIPFKDPSSLENAMHCWLLLLLMGLPEAKIRSGLLNLHPIEMRLQQTEGIHQIQLINDYYNSDLASLVIALDFLARQQMNAKKTVILSDLEQTDLPPAKLYRRVAKMMNDRGIERLIGIGPNISSMNFVFKCKDKIFFKDTDSFVEQIPGLPFGNETILIKGARSYSFEKIGRKLQKQSHETTLEINLSAMEQNLDYFRSCLKPTTKIMAMVKAYSYGSGSHEVAKMLQYKKVDYLAVAYLDEGISLRQAGISIPIMVMNTDALQFDVLYDYKLEPAVYSLEQLKALADYHQNSGVESISLHLEFDTGMHRLGFEEKEIDGIMEVLKENTGLTVSSVFSHLAGSDEKVHEAFTQRQISLYNQIVKKLSKALLYPFLKHILNSAGILHYSNAQMDMVRLGIGLYGIDPTVTYNKNLRTVSTLRSYISQIREVHANEGVGYGLHSKSRNKRNIATVAIGYADGLNRHLSQGKGYFLVNGKKAPIAGNVCMDMTMIDVTGIDCKSGDGVIIFGEKPSLTNISKILKTIPYEILTSVSQRVRRVYVQE